MERFFTGRELVNTSSRLEWNAALLITELAPSDLLTYLFDFELLRK